MTLTDGIGGRRDVRGCLGGPERVLCVLGESEAAIAACTAGSLAVLAVGRWCTDICGHRHDDSDTKTDVGGHKGIIKRDLGDFCLYARNLFVPAVTTSPQACAATGHLAWSHGRGRGR